MPRPVLHTARLELRPMTSTHLPLLHRLDSDAEVMRYEITCCGVGGGLAVVDPAYPVRRINHSPTRQR